MKTICRSRDELTSRARCAFLVVAGIVYAALGLSAVAVAQDEKDPFQGALFPVELVMGNQAAISFTSDQRDATVVALQRTQSAVVPWQLSLSASGERLLALLRQPRVDTEAALAEVEELLRLENRVKLEQVRLLIDVKNILTREQQRKLEAIRGLQ